MTPLTLGNARRQPPPYTLRLSVQDVQALRDRARLEQVPPTALAREVLRQYLAGNTKIEIPIS